MSDQEQEGTQSAPNEETGGDHVEGDKVVNPPDEGGTGEGGSGSSGGDAE